MALPSRRPEVVRLSVAGMKQSDIAREVGVSRQRVIQILQKEGLWMPRTRKVKPPRESRDERRARILGCPVELYLKLRAMPSEPIAAYGQQRATARVRGIEWQFTLQTWWEVWEKSGKWEQRGRGYGQFVMARFRDLGPYAPDNVRITTSSRNMHEYHDYRRPRRVGFHMPSFRASGLTMDNLNGNGDSD